MERLTNILHYTVFTIILLAMALIVTIQTPYVQTAITNKVIKTLEDNFDADIELQSVHFKPMNTLLLKGLSIVDHSPCSEDARDTLLYAGSLGIRFSISSLLNPLHDDIILKEVKIKDSQFNLVIEDNEWGNNLSRMFRLIPPKDKEPMPERDIITIRNILAENLSYSMQNYIIGRNPELPRHAIDWADMGVDDISLRARDFSISHGLFSAIVDHLSFRERTGWTVKEMKCSTVTGKGRVLISGVELYDGVSRAYFDFSMTGRSEDYQDFVNKVALDARIRKGKFSLEMLSRFIPPLAPTPGVCLNANGHAYGPVRDMTAKNFTIKAEKSNVEMTVNGKVTGLPDVNAMRLEVHVDPIIFNVTDLCHLVNAMAPGAELDPQRLAGTGLFTARADVNGTLRNMDAELSLDQDGGEYDAGLNLHADNIIGGGRRSFRGSLDADNLNLEALLGDEKFGFATAAVAFDLRLPYGEAPIDARVDSLRINSFQYNGYTYQDITGNLCLQNADLTADIQSHDKAADADITVWSDKYSYNGAIIIRKADLNAMNFDSRGTSVVSLNAYGHVDRNLDMLQGNANISEITLVNDKGVHEVDDINLSAANTDDGYDILLESDLAHATFNGNLEHFRTEIESYNTTSLLAYVMPGLYMEYGTHVQVSKDSSGIIAGSVNSGRIARGRDYIRNLDIQVAGDLDSLNATLSASQIKLLGFSLNNNTLEACRQDSLFTFDYAFNNAGLDVEKEIGHGKISLDMILGRDKSIDFRFKPSELSFNGRDWTLNESYIRMKGREIKVSDFLLKSGDHWVSVDGATSETEKEILSAELHNMDLATLNEFTDKDMNYRGRVNSICRLYSPLGTDFPMLETETYATGLGIGSTELGDLTVKSVADLEGQSFNAGITDKLDSRTILKGQLVFKPYERTLDAGIGFDRFPIGFVRNILPDIFDNVEGNVSGRVGIKGPTDMLELSSNATRLDGGVLKIGFTGVSYNLNGPFSIGSNGVSFGGIRVTDGLNGKGTLSGGIKWNRFRNARMDMRLNMENMKALGISADKASSPVSGNVFASGNVGLEGPFNELTLSANFRTTGKSDLHIALSGAAQATKGDLLVFTSEDNEQEDPYLTLLRNIEEEEEEEGQSNFKVKLHAVADPTMVVALDLGSQGFAAGLEGQGNGDIDFSLDTGNSDFGITGNYVLTDGKFDVNASNLVHRNFSISDGSSIKFGGDVMQSTVNLDATYQTKASIEALIADKNAVANRRTVNCGIHIQNKLSNPDIKFSIDIPDLSPSAKAQVESALSTDDKIQRQFLSLLLSGNFLPDEQSGIVNNNSLLFSNVSEIMANQVNSIFTRLNIPLDLGLNYQPSDDGTRNLFDVALSTQLFNNRVIIGGNLGNRQNISSSGQTIFGDLDIQYKVVRSGSLRLNLFSHAADKYTNALDDSQKNGIGITWQQEFDQLPEWIKRLFSNKVQKEVLTRLMTEKARKTQTLILDE